MHIGFDKTYKFLLCLIEMLSLEKTTALFLLNKSAHETNVTSQIRGLFHNLLAYENYEFEIVKNTPNLEA
jgi:dimeric dUTPase (all-alpha-NTP-PPase superfamily)